MEPFKVHTPASAPAGSGEILGAMHKQNGFVPNLYGIMAASPQVVKAYDELNSLFMETSFTTVEKNVVLLAVSSVNECHYCMSIHSMVAEMFKVPADVIESLRNNKPIESDPKLEALRKFAITMTETRGWPSPDEVDDFLSAGYTKEQILELIVGIAQKTISNYVNHIAQTPLDEPVKPYKWEPAE
ncbi:MAG: carboxymuconolactone decarboxylase family protein [Marinilabilia sp.]